MKTTKNNLRKARTKDGKWRVFGYGTLREGRRRYWVKGRLWLRPTGHAAVDFEAAGYVAGEVFEVDAEGLEELDRREGTGCAPAFYRRVLVKTRSGLVCWGYEWAQSFDGFSRVTDGIWRFGYLRTWRKRYDNNPLARRELGACFHNAAQESATSG